MNIRIKEAIRFALMSGNDVSIMDIAKVLWPDSKETTQRVNISKLLNGKTKTYSLEWIKTICEITGTDANFLFNVKNMNNEN